MSVINVSGSKTMIPNIDTSAFLIVYFHDGKLKVVGDGEIDIKDLLPIILKAAADRIR